MLHLRKLDMENVWKIIKRTRQSYLLQHPDLYLNCYEKISTSILKELINNFTKELEISTKYPPEEKVSDKTLKTSAEILIYLLHCPQFKPKLLLFMSYILQYETPKELVLAWTNLLKTSQAGEKKENIEILTQVLEGFNLDFYEKLQIITKRKCFINGTFDTCPQKKAAVTDEESLKILGSFC